MPASPGLAGMLNSYLSISFHLSVEICVDALLILFIYGAFFVSRQQGVEGWGCNDASAPRHCNCLQPLGTDLITPFIIFNLFTFHPFRNSKVMDGLRCGSPLQRQLDLCCS